MTNIVQSTDEANMRDYPLWVQAPAGETALPYTVGDLRLLAAVGAPSTGVLGPSDFVVTSSVTPGNVTVSAGIGVTAPTGIAGFSGSRTRERYVFGSDGPVDVAVYTNGGTTTRFHRLVAQAVDEQLPMGATSSPWTFRLIEDTGTPPTSNGGNAIALATVAVNAGQTSGYAITDLRYPCGHVMACAVSGVATGTAALSNGFRKALYFNTEVDDPWSMYNSSDKSAVHIRTDGYYDLFTSASTSDASPIYLSITVNPAGVDNTSLGAAELPESVTVAGGVFGGAHGSSYVPNVLLHAGDVIRAAIMGSSTANVTQSTLRVVRREARS